MQGCVIVSRAVFIQEAAFSQGRAGYESLCREQLLSGVAEGKWAGGSREGVNIYPKLGEFVKRLLADCQMPESTSAHPGLLSFPELCAPVLDCTSFRRCPPERGWTQASIADPARERIKEATPSCRPQLLIPWRAVPNGFWPWVQYLWPSASLYVHIFM